MSVAILGCVVVLVLVWVFCGFQRWRRWGVVMVVVVWGCFSVKSSFTVISCAIFSSGDAGRGSGSSVLGLLWFSTVAASGCGGGGLGLL